MNAILIWLLIQPLKLTAMLAAWLLAWPAAAISMRRPANDPLPPWLRWMLTHDNPIDALWQQPHHLQSYASLRDVDPARFATDYSLRRRARAYWLQRNPAAGLSYWMGVPKDGLVEHVLYGVGAWDSGESNLLVRLWKRDGATKAFQVRGQWVYPFAPRYYLRVNLGYKDSGTHDRVLPVLHINPFRGLLT